MLALWQWSGLRIVCAPASGTGRVLCGASVVGGVVVSEWCVE